MLDVQVTKDELHFGASVTLRFMRTLRIADPGQQCPLTPGLGSFAIYRVADYPQRVPARWRERGGVFIPIHRCEAMWIDFSGRWWKPNAVKIGMAGLNAVSGEAWAEGLSDVPQAYVIVPEQPRLEGICVGSSLIRQFVAEPWDAGRTVNHHGLNAEEAGCLTIMVFEPKPGLFAEIPYRLDEPMDATDPSHPWIQPEMCPPSRGRTGLRVQPDEYGRDTWDLANYGAIDVHLVNGRQFRSITGLAPPSTPVSVETYTRAGLPWLDSYDETDSGVLTTQAMLG